MSVRMVGERLLVVHDRPADLDDDDLVVKPLDVGQGLDQAGAFGIAASIKCVLQKEKRASLETTSCTVKEMIRALMVLLPLAVSQISTRHLLRNRKRGLGAS